MRLLHERQTGRPLETDRLAEAIARTNEARALLVEVFEFARAVPSPVRPRDLVNVGVVAALLLGTQAGVGVARAFRDELAATRARQAGAPRERVRLMWLQNRIQFKHPVVKWLTEMGAVVVMDELNDVQWDPIDPADPYLGMARRALSISLIGTAERRLTRIRQLAREYQVDGVINPCHWGCRQGTGARGLIQEGFQADGVPVLNLEVDCVDARNFAEGQLRTRLEAFVEMLADRMGA